MMKKNNFIVKGTFAILLLLLALPLVAQVEFKLQTDIGTRFNDINNEGVGVTRFQYYDFETNVLSPMEEEATGVTAINNDGDVAGSMFLDDTETDQQPAVRIDGTWVPIGWFPQSDPSDSNFVVYEISENGRYVTGQMSVGCCTFGTYLYDTLTGVLTDVFDPEGEPLTAFTVNNDGLMAGWVDRPNDAGTLRVPVYYDADANLTIIPDSNDLPSFGINSVNDINANNVMVGERDGKPFIYDLATDSFTDFTLTNGNTGVFTSISDTGVAVGYENTDFQERDAIIYHPTLGAAPVYLKDVLDDFGVTVGTLDGLLGTAISISDDGNYIVGWVNGPPIFAEGWAVHFDDLLLFESDCEITCPDDIEVEAETGASSAVVDYTVSFECDDETPPGTELVLVSGLASGSEFPLGETSVFYQLEDGDGNILDSCSFSVIVNDVYCVPDVNFIVEPITRVVFESIDNSSSPETTSPIQEYFLDISTEVIQGETYPIILEGNTNGPFVNFFTVFIDWNQDQVFQDSERYEAGSIEESTGTDGLQATGEILVPLDAIVGSTRMRVFKNYNVVGEDPCATIDYGQSEDYTINVTSTAGINDFNATSISLYPNPVQDLLSITSGTLIDSITVFSITGQEVLKTSVNDLTTQINVSSLQSGVYLVNVASEAGTKNLRVIKK